MKQIIYKYPLDLGTNIIELPIGAEVLSTECQENKIMIWCLIDPSEYQVEERVFEIVGTGQPIEVVNGSRKWKFIGTVMQGGGIFVWHVFEEMNF